MKTLLVICAAISVFGACNGAEVNINFVLLFVHYNLKRIEFYRKNR